MRVIEIAGTYMRSATEIALHLYMSCHKGVRIVKLTVHQKKGMSATPKSELKFGRNHVRGGLES